MSLSVNRYWSAVAADLTCHTVLHKCVLIINTTQEHCHSDHTDVQHGRHLVGHTIIFHLNFICANVENTCIS